MRCRILALCLILSTTQAIISTNTLTFYNLRDTGAGTTFLGAAWESSSVGACALECLVRYPSTVVSFTFHTKLRLCTPGSSVTTALPAPDSATVGDLYGPLLVCNPTDHFSLVTSDQGTRTCYTLLPDIVSTDYGVIIMTQPDHKVSCAMLGGHLAEINTADEFAMAVEFMPEGTIAFIDGERESPGGPFVWTGTGEHFNADQVLFFAKGQPNDDSEMCICLRFFELHDCPCTRTFPGLCEGPMTS